MDDSFSNHSNRHSAKRSKQKKLSTHIDMTPMVDLGFLLVTFFILTTSLNKPTVMEVIMPEEGHGTTWRDSETLNLLIGQEEIVFYYGKDITSHQAVTWNNLRKFLLEANEQILDLQRKNNWEENGVMTLIKPGSESSYGNLVDLLDELKITRINTYAIVDVNAAELTVLNK